MTKSDAIVTALKNAAQVGVDTDDALDQLSDLVDVVHAKPAPHKKPEVVLSEVPLGFGDKTCVVGWDTCGACHFRVSKCECPNGPVEPNYVKKFRQEGPITVASQMPTPVTKVTTESSLPRSSEVEITSESKGEVCKVCKIPITSDNADQNDDKSYTHHDCQGEA
jgi:hypothetical protein